MDEEGPPAFLSQIDRELGSGLSLELQFYGLGLAAQQDVEPGNQHAADEEGEDAWQSPLIKARTYQSSAVSVSDDTVRSAAPGARRDPVFSVALAGAGAFFAAAFFAVAFFAVAFFAVAFFVACPFAAAGFFVAGALFAADLRTPAFFVPADLRAPARLDGPAARRSAISSAARSGVRASGSSPLRREAFVVPSVT